MLVDEIQYDIEEDYGFFCDIDLYDDEIRESFIITPLPIKHVEVDTLETTTPHHNYFTKRYAILLLDTIFIIGILTSSISMSYAYIYKNK